MKCFSALFIICFSVLQHQTFYSFFLIRVNYFRDSQEVIYKFFMCLFAFIAFIKTTPTGEALFVTHPNVMMIMVLMIVLFFLSWISATLLREHSWIFSVILVCVILVIGSVSTILVLTIISSQIAWLTSLLWVGIFAVIGYYYYQELFKLVVCAISDTIKKLTESYNSKRQSTRLPV